MIIKTIYVFANDVDNIGGDYIVVGIEDDTEYPNVVSSLIANDF